MRGIHKQIVVLNEFENPLFEQAIFILRSDASKNANRTSDNVLKEARSVVNGYIKRNCSSSDMTLTRPKTGLVTLVKRKLFFKIAIAACSVGLLTAIALYVLPL